MPDLADFWSRYLIAARDRGEIHPDTDIAEASEWVARVLISLATVPGDTLDPDDADAVLIHVRRYVMPGLQAGPRGGYAMTSALIAAVGRRRSVVRRADPPHAEPHPHGQYFPYR